MLISLGEFNVYMCFPFIAGFFYFIRQALYNILCETYSNKQQYDQALQHYLIVSPPPVQELLNTCLLLSKTDLYLTILFDNVKEDDKRKQSIQKLCSHLRNGKAEDIEKAATIYVGF